MTAEAKPASTDRALMLRVLRTYAGPHWRGLALAFLCAAGSAAMTFALNYLVKVASDGMQIGQNAMAIISVAVAIACVGLLRGVFLAIQMRVGNRIGHVVVGDMQIDLISALVRSDLARLRGVHSGQYVSSMLYDAGLIREVATTNAVFWVQHALTLIGLAVYMVWVDVGLAALVFLGAPLAVRLIRTFAQRTRRAATGAMSETSSLSTAIMESLDGVKIVKLENQEDDQTARVGDVVRRRQYFLIKGSNAKAISAPVTETLMTLIIAGIVAYASWRASTGDLTVGEFTSFLTALIFAGQSVRVLANMQTIIAEASSAAARLFDTLDVVAEIKDAPDAAALPAGPSHVRFEDVSFDYGAGAPTLEQVSFEVKRGETIALVGPSGGGKSTALNMIPRFYDASGGAITIDGHDIRAVTLRSLRDRIALVTQEPFLFDDTIRNNIAFGRPDASQAQIEAAAGAAAAHDFISALPNGYDTTVGEAGARLSGGQRQRIAIARAFLKDAPILLLDEATSALDTESEAQVQAALERLMAGRTTIVIAHRLSTVRSADRIYVLDRGTIAESGTHESLIAQGGLYSRLAQSQDLSVADAAV